MRNMMQKERNNSENFLPFEKAEKKLFIKKESTSEQGINPESRSVEELINYGIINLNKPRGPSSHQVSAYVQQILGIDKAGHSGTLDPHVTGVLPIALGKATRIVQTLLKAGKEYVGIMHLHTDIPDEEIKNVAEQFTGKIEQLPPIRSAVKRRLRTREIYYLEILEIKGRDVLFKVGSEAGFYVRKFCHDFGLKLKTNAHMLQLIRTKAGPFKEKDWHSLHDLKDAYTLWKEKEDEEEIRKVILPIERAVEHLPKIWVMDSAVNTLCHGADLNVPGICRYNEFNEDQIVAIMTLKNELVCLADAVEHSSFIKNNDKGKIAKTKKVFMERNTYK